MFCILFPCWEHGSEMQLGKVTWVPPTSLALSPDPVLSPDVCSLLFPEAENHIKSVFSPSYCFKWRWCEFSSTTQALELEDHQDFSSCLISEHKLFYMILRNADLPWPQANFLPWFQSHLLYQKDDDTHFPCWKHQWWLRNDQWLSAVVKENIFIKTLHLPSLFWWICSLSKTWYTRNQHNCAKDSVISFFF